MNNRLGRAILSQCFLIDLVTILILDRHLVDDPKTIGPIEVHIRLDRRLRLPDERFAAKLGLCKALSRDHVGLPDELLIRQAG